MKKQLKKALSITLAALLLTAGFGGTAVAANNPPRRVATFIVTVPCGTLLRIEEKLIGPVFEKIITLSPFLQKDGWCKDYITFITRPDGEYFFYCNDTDTKPGKVYALNWRFNWWEKGAVIVSPICGN